MTLAIDIDGTLSAYPQQLVGLGLGAEAIGWRVVFLSGGLGQALSAARLSEIQHAKEEQVYRLGAPAWQVVPCMGRTTADVAQAKAAWCQRHGVTVLIDDSQEYCDAVRRLSPATAVLRVVA